MDGRTEYAARDEIVRVGKLMWERNMIAAGDGNLSIRLSKDRILCTPSGLSKGFLQAEQLVTIDLEGNKVGPNLGAARDLAPSSEIKIHLECYRRRSDIGAVIHAHPPFAIGCTLVGISLAKCILPEVVYDLGTIPTLPYATPTSIEGPERIREIIPSFDALMLERHGSVTVGKTLWDAYMRLERVEHSAQIALLANAVQTVTPLTDEQIQKLAALRRGLFAQRGRDVCAECNACAASGRHVGRADPALIMMR